ncbi:carboxylesterase family protein [Aurantiacibacter poecillastricola]|uniref:carboxylesterase family protein n=1 Tax=Aurantiacibacter poecillastricola TaxID=3064385 RepID=UPI00273EC488|nr:alpha/beta hydrolase-fold protein [Aurantiacibacter sp. 219JJ12-13]MDP5261290.1 alpha/beta hydrolase-fold protein [Aurantiacibacter sp. 219JJ12-13]
MAPHSIASAQQFEPIDDLQWLAIENIVSPVLRPDAENVDEARRLTDLARESLLQGRYGEARRLYSQARALFLGVPWNEQAEFVASLALRPARVAVDPGEDLALAIGQHFSASIPPDIAYSDVHLRFSARPFRHSGSHEARPLGTIWLATPDLAEEPQYASLDLAGLGDGSWEIEAEIIHGGEVLGTTVTRLFTATDLREDSRKLREGLARLDPAPGLAADIAFPLDLVETLNQRSRRVRDIDLRSELDAALFLLAAAERLENPQYQARGLQGRHYRSDISGRIEPYRLFIPRRWDGRSELALLVVLHGSAGDECSAFASGVLEQLAEVHGLAVLSPMGDDPNSVWGNRLPVVLADGTVPPPRPVVSGGRVQPVTGLPVEPAEADVAATLALVRQEYPIDADRIYLAGNSMGGEGTLHLASLWPDMWAAIAPGAGPIDPHQLDYSALASIPTLIVHGRNDRITSFTASQRIFERLQQEGGEASMLATEDGHDAFDRNLEAILGFLLSHSRNARN